MIKAMFKKIFASNDNNESDVVNPKSWLTNFLGGITVSGENVTKENSLSIDGVYACVNIKANAVAKMPFQMFRKNNGSKERISNHRAVELLETRPNPMMSAFIFKHTAVVHEELWGNAYIWIEADNKGYPKALWLLNPALTTVYIDEDKNKIWYLTKVNNKYYKFQSEEIIHFRSLSTDGLVGKSRIEVARETLGNLRASNKLIGKFFKNGTATGGVIKYAQKLGKESKAKIREAWQSANSGLDNAAKVAILDMGLNYENIGMSFEDAQFIQLNKFGIAKLSRIFNVPLHKLAELDRATFSNIEQQAMEFIEDSIQPIVTEWEQEVTYKLFSKAERIKGYYVKFNLASALRADSETRAKYYKELLGMGVYNINDIRQLEEKNSIGPQGDKHRISLNYVSIDIADEYQLAKAKAGKGGEKKSE